ncbi:MAG: glycosyltransferase family 2 protein [Deltaproteobacteria bacterium]|nr:glycosyltransferase family 2 protein [Deltaproteobacteria bacterium]
MPRAEHHPFRERRTLYAVVIPVINEGEKILGQLARMRELGLMDLADVLLADGGSIDGSLEPGRLAGLGVRALLIKRDQGRLGAQLRMGYAYALQEGYQGVVTIDGNGKDGVEAIPRFVAALLSGVDYAQASRFLPGGRGVNTPLIRTLAIRLIHAPAVSLAAGRWLSDTTQGFRAYSRRYLLHPAVQPFREIFQEYELLAYLSARASQLGLAVSQIPTTRIYPASGPTPTKIKSLAAYGDLLAVLWNLNLGRYAPPGA